MTCYASMSIYLLQLERKINPARGISQALETNTNT